MFGALPSVYDATLYRTASNGFLFNCGDFSNNNDGTTVHHYTISVYMIETVASGAGQRVFDIKINKGGTISTLTSGFDIYATCGGSTARALTYTGVAVSSNAFRLQFVNSTGTTYDATVSAISIIQTD